MIEEQTNFDYAAGIIGIAPLTSGPSFIQTFCDYNGYQKLVSLAFTKQDQTSTITIGAVNQDDYTGDLKKYDAL